MAVFATACIAAGLGGTMMNVDEARDWTLTGVGLGLVVFALEHVSVLRPPGRATVLRTGAVTAGAILVAAGSLTETFKLTDGSGYTLYGAAVIVLTLLADQQWQARRSAQSRTARPD